MNGPFLREDAAPPTSTADLQQPRPLEIGKKDDEKESGGARATITNLKIGVNIIKEIDHKITGKERCKIYKQYWRPIQEYITEIGAENVIYMLINKSKKLFYIGEAKNLISRFSSGKYDQKWEYYRYDKLPDELEKHRLE